MDKRPFVGRGLPGPRGKKVVSKDRRFLATSTKAAPVVAARGRGVYIEDVDGNVFLDFTCGAGVTNTGHCHPGVVRAIQAQAEELLHFAGTDFYYEVQSRLAERLARITPGGFAKRVFFTNSGAESIEAAIKLARWTTQRPLFIGFIWAFHGRTMGALSLTASKPVQRARYFPTMPGVVHIPYAYCYRCPYKLEHPGCELWCARILEELYFRSFVPPEEVAAIVAEPIQGEGGYMVPPDGFFPELKRIAERHGILFVDDEVQAGFGRTGRWFCTEHYGTVPDIVTMAKGMGSGFPIGAAVFRRELDWGVKGAHSNTYGGNPMGCAASLATMDVIQSEGLLENATRVGAHLHKRLLELQERHECVGDVRGKGLMQATEFVKDRRTKEEAPELRDRIERLALKRGLILLGCGRSAIRYIPPLLITREQVDAAMDILEDAIKEAVRG
ncbi:MAG: acetyl ornithine aminotransferase family protein [Thermoplasmatota archaeon]